MAQRCKTCSHPRIAEIDKDLLSNIAYTRIAAKFGINPKSVEYHAKQHVQPLIDAANQAAKDAIVQRVLTFREEVNYSTLEKVKMLQDSIWTDLDGTPEIEKRVALYREFRGAVQEEAKLTGLYQKEGQNQNDLDRVAKAYRKFLDDFPQATDQERDKFLDMFATEAGVSAATIRKQMQIQELGGVQ